MADIAQGTPTIKFGGIDILPQYPTYRAFHKDVAQSNTYYVPTRITQMPKVDAQIMIEYFRQYLNFGFYTEYFARMMLRKFAETAARYSPPNIGKASIEEKYYYRPIYKLEDLAKGLCRTTTGKRLYATKEDYAALRKGMKFKIMNTKYRVKRGTVYAYAKGINEAKRLSRIENRGLTKYSWGNILQTFNKNNIALLNQNTRFGTLSIAPGKEDRQVGRRVLIQTEMPPIFQRLERKSPNIKKYRFGSVDWQESEKGNNIDINIHNTLAEVERYCEIAIRQGAKAAVKQATKLIGWIQSGTKDKIEKMFNFNMWQVTRVTALTYRKGSK